MTATEELTDDQVLELVRQRGLVHETAQWTVGSFTDA